MRRALLPLALVILLGVCVNSSAQTSAKPADEKNSLTARIAGLQKRDGFFPYYWDEKKSDILFELSPAALPFLDYRYCAGLMV